MKKLMAVTLAILMLVSTFALVSCGNKDEEDLTNIDDYVAPSYTKDIGTGVITYADGTGDTAIITNYEPKIYTPHDIVIPEKVGNGDDKVVTGIGDEAFKACASMKSVTLPATITSIGKAAFYQCDSLVEINIPAAVKTIGELAFANCDALTYVNFTADSSLYEIGKNAFDGCVSIEKFLLPAKLTTIGEGAFRNCTKLARVDVPESVKTIGAQAYVGCASLDYVGCIVLTDKIENIGGFDPKAKDEALVVVFDTDKKNIKAPEGSYAAAYISAMRDVEG